MMLAIILLSESLVADGTPEFFDLVGTQMRSETVSASVILRAQETLVWQGRFLCSGALLYSVPGSIVQVLQSKCLACRA